VQARPVTLLDVNDVTRGGIAMELVHTTRGIVSHSPKATAVTVAACAVAIVALALLLAGVGSRGSIAAVPAPVAAGGLTPQEWRYVQGIESLSPSQLAAAFGTGHGIAPPAVEQLTPIQRLEAYGTDMRAAATLAGLTRPERLYAESIMAMTPAELRAAFGTSTGEGSNR
jgi:hypothetical protein